MKLVRAIREGRILPYKPHEEREREEEEKEEVHFDLWQNEEYQEPNPMHIPAPKLPPPGYDLSYNPPQEYLPCVSPCARFDLDTPLTAILGPGRSERNGKTPTPKTAKRSTSRNSTVRYGRSLPGVAWSRSGSSGAWYVDRGRWCGFAGLTPSSTGPLFGPSRAEEPA